MIQLLTSMPTLSFQADEKEFNLFISELERLFCPCQPITWCITARYWVQKNEKYKNISLLSLLSLNCLCVLSLNSDWLVLATIYQKQRQDEKNINHCQTTFCRGKSLGKLLCKTELKCSDELSLVSLVSSNGNSSNLNICCIKRNFL